MENYYEDQQLPSLMKKDNEKNNNEPFREERDAEGNVIMLQWEDGAPIRRFSKRLPACKKCDGSGTFLYHHATCKACEGTGYGPIPTGDEEVEVELNGETGQLEEKKSDPESEPIWTEVRGSSAFYDICPICGSMIPGTGPTIPCADGKDRRPKELHEWWHKTVHCDWYQNE